jgi:hypothetical protein
MGAGAATDHHVGENGVGGVEPQIGFGCTIELIRPMLERRALSPMRVCGGSMARN